MRDRLPLATTPSGIDAGVSAARKGLKKDRLQLRDRGKTPVTVAPEPDLFVRVIKLFALL